MKTRKKKWNEKVEIVHGSYLRAKQNKTFSKRFYQNLFFLHPEIEKFFEKTDFEHQEKALINGLNILFQYFDADDNARTQITRLGRVHSVNGINIHPHLYYYWTEALIMNLKEFDKIWYDEVEYYTREVISYPVSFFISQYFLEDRK